MTPPLDPPRSEDVPPQFCARCGTPNERAGRFCRSCGTELMPLSGGTGPPSSPSKTWLLALGAVVVAALAVAGFMVLRGGSSNESATTEPDDPAVSSSAGSVLDVETPTTAAEKPIDEDLPPTELSTTTVAAPAKTAPTVNDRTQTIGLGGTVPTCRSALRDDTSVESLSQLDLSGLDLTVGSKDFVEQFVLGNLVMVGLEAAGANVIDETNLGGTLANREALVDGDIDMYWEYNGTGWTNFIGRSDPSFDGEQLSDDVCTADLDQNGVRWVGRTPFNNSYGFATAGNSPAAGGDLAAMMDFVVANPDATVCMETEYPNRPDGLVLLEQATGLTIPDAQIEILDTGVIYDATASGDCTFGEVFATDGRIPAYGLDLVEDPGVHVVYNASLTMPDELYRQAPEAFEAFADTILAGLDDATMAELNRQVAEDRRHPLMVAEVYLAGKDLL